MEKRTRNAVFAAIAITAALVPPALSAAQEEPLPCQATKLWAEVRYFRCLARCEDGRSARAPECSAACQMRYDDRITEIEKLPACTGEPAGPAPDANQCNAHLLRAAAREITCRYSCAQRSVRSSSFDVARCNDGCTARLEKVKQRIMARPFCRGHKGELPTVR